MRDASVKIHHWLYPLSWLYGIGVCLRNKLFDWGWLRSKSFDIPVICVGNLAVGGTGKTPHTEYLIRLLQNEGINVAVLSRGYKRKSKGYILATAESSAGKIGDEPYQIKSKFPDIRVAVDEDRCHGIEQLLKLKNPAVDAVLLDDAFQHRRVKAGLNILLTDFHRLLCDDVLLPAGRLRTRRRKEPRTNSHRHEVSGQYQADRFQYHHQTAASISVPATVFLQIPLRIVDTAIPGDRERDCLYRQRTSASRYGHRLSRPIGGRSEIAYSKRQPAGFRRPPRLQHERPATHRRTVLAAGKRQKDDYHNGKGCHPAEKSPGPERNTETVYIRASYQDRAFAKSTIYI